MAALKGYRTILVNLAMTLPPAWDVLVQFLVQNSAQIEPLIPAEWMPEYVLAMGIVNLWLRYVTTTPVGSKT